MGWRGNGFGSRQGDAGGLLEVIEEGDALPGEEQIGEGGALSMADFKGEKASWLESGVGLGDEATVDVEAGGTSEERGARLVVADLWVELRGVGVGDVGGVADDGVEGSTGLFFGGDGREEVGPKEADTMGQIVLAGVGFRNVEGFGREIEGGDFGLGEVRSKGDRDGSGAGAYVCDAEGLVGERLEVGEDGFDEVLGLGARDEDGGSDAEVEAVELLVAGDVLDGLVEEAASYGRFVGGLLRGGELAGGVREEGGSRDLESVEEKEFGVATGLVTEMRVGIELMRGECEGFAESHVCG